jgi:hypothetical protein
MLENIIIFGLLLVIAIYFINDSSGLKQNINTNQVDAAYPPMINPLINPIVNPVQPPLFMGRPLHQHMPGIEYDYKTLNDPLVPPYKRDEWNMIVPGYHTRGPPMPFHKYGTLTNASLPNNDKYKFLFLMGRQKYPGSNNYDYYATGTSDHSDIKFDLPTMTKELYNDDKIKINQLGESEYTLIVDRPLNLEYNPYF